MPFVASLLVAELAIYGGFFFLISKVLDIGVPLDALWAAVHRAWLGAAGTLLLLVVHIFLRLGGAEPDTLELAVTVAVWFIRAGVWTWVTTRVYRVTRWRKWKLAVVVAGGLALNGGVEFGLSRLGAWSAPSFGSWVFRLC
jgi:hypothetical protein